MRFGHRPRSLLEFQGKYSATSHPVAESWPDLAEYSPATAPETPTPALQPHHAPTTAPRRAVPRMPSTCSRRPHTTPAGSHDFLALRVALAAW